MPCCKEKEKKASTCPTRRPRLIRQQPRSVRPPASGGTDAATRRCPPVPSRLVPSRPVEPDAPGAPSPPAPGAARRESPSPGRAAGRWARLTALAERPVGPAAPAAACPGNRAPACDERRLREKAKPRWAQLPPRQKAALPRAKGPPL